MTDEDDNDDEDEVSTPLFFPRERPQDDVPP